MCNQVNNRIPYVKAVRDCNEVRTYEVRERPRPGGRRGPGKNIKLWSSELENFCQSKTGVVLNQS